MLRLVQSLTAQKTCQRPEVVAQTWVGTLLASSLTAQRTVLMLLPPAQTLQLILTVQRMAQVMQLSDQRLAQHLTGRKQVQLQSQSVMHQRQSLECWQLQWELLLSLAVQEPDQTMGEMACLG